MSAAMGIVTNVNMDDSTVFIRTNENEGSQDLVIENVASPVNVGDAVSLNDLGEIESVNQVDWSQATGIAPGGDWSRADLVATGPGLTIDPLYTPTFDPRNPHQHNPFLRPDADWRITTQDPDRMVVNAIAALGENNQLALNNRLPWKYPEDLELYHDKVRGKTVIMGRATFESVPNSFQEIPENIIIVSTTMDDCDDENIHLADNVQEAIGIADDIGAKEVWICGGVRIYKEALEQDLIEELHISHIPYEGEADRFFPNFTKYIYEVKEGTTIECEGQRPFVYKVYRMKEYENNLFLNNGPALHPSDVLSVQYDNASSGLTATNVQDALEELDRNFGQPDTMIANPNVMGQLSAVSSGLEWTTQENADQVGQAYFNREDDRVYIVTEDGPVPMSDNHNDMHEAVQLAAHEVAEEFTSGDWHISDTTYHEISAAMTDRMRQIHPEANVQCNITVDNSVAPVYTIGRVGAVDYSPSYQNTRLHVRVEILYNVYDLELQLR